MPDLEMLRRALESSQEDLLFWRVGRGENPLEVAMARAWLLSLMSGPLPPPVFRVRVTTKVLNVRAEASTDSNVIGVLRKGQEVAVLANTANGWYRLSGQAGYIAVQYTEKIT